MSPTYKRWYDHDPLLLEVIELLRNYQPELRAQAEIFLQKLEEKLSKETKDKIGEYSLTVKDDEGNQNIADLSSTYDTMIFNVYRDAMSVPHFLDDTIIRLIVKFFSSLNNTNFRKNWFFFNV